MQSELASLSSSLSQAHGKSSDLSLNISKVISHFIKSYLESHSNSELTQDLNQQVSDLLKKDQFDDRSKFFFEKISNDCKSLWEIFASSQTENKLGKIKQKVFSIFETYYDYFSAIRKFSQVHSSPDFLQSEQVLLSLLNRGNLYKRIDKINESYDYRKISSILTNIFFLFNKLILDFENAKLNNPESLKTVKENIFLTLQKFPGIEDFGCLDGLNSQLVSAIQSLSHQSIFYKTLQEKHQLFSWQIGNIVSQEYERHVKTYLIYLLGNYQDSNLCKELDKIDQFYHSPNYEVNLAHIYSVFDQLKHDNFFDQLFEEYQVFYTKYLNPLRLINSYFDHLSMVYESDFFLGFDIICHDTDNKKQVEALEEFHQIVLKLQSQFTPIELKGLALDHQFFLEEEDTENKGFRKLLSPAEFKAKIFRVFNKEFSELYPDYFDQDSIDFFKYLPSKKDLFDDDKLSYLDPAKMQNLINLFEKIEETDPVEIKKEKLNKIASGLIILKQIASNRTSLKFKFPNNSSIECEFYFFDFFKNFLLQKGVNFFDLFFDADGNIKKEYQAPELQFIFKYIKDYEEKIAFGLLPFNEDLKNIIEIKKAIDSGNIQSLQENIQFLPLDEIVSFLEMYSNDYSLYNEGVVKAFCQIFISKYSRDLNTILSHNRISDQGPFAHLFQAFNQLFESREPRELSDSWESRESSEILINYSYNQKERLKQVLVFKRGNIFELALKKKKPEVSEIIFEFFKNDLMGIYPPYKELPQEYIIKGFSLLYLGFAHKKRSITNKILSIFYLSNQKEVIDSFKSYNILNLLVEDNDLENLKMLLNYLKANIEKEDLKELITSVRIDYDQNQCLPAIETAIRKASKEVFLLLLENFDQHDLNKIYNNKYSFLGLACDYDRKEVVEILLERGANPNVEQRNGVYPLHFACEKGNYEIVNLLLDRDAKDAVDNKGLYALSYACLHDQKEIVRLFLEKNKKDDYTSEINIAIKENKKDIIEIFFEYGVKIDIDALKASENKEVSQLAELFTNPEFIKQRDEKLKRFRPKPKAHSPEKVEISGSLRGDLQRDQRLR